MLFYPSECRAPFRYQRERLALRTLFPRLLGTLDEVRRGFCTGSISRRKNDHFADFTVLLDSHAISTQRMIWTASPFFGLRAFDRTILRLHPADLGILALFSRFPPGVMPTIMKPCFTAYRERVGFRIKS